MKHSIISKAREADALLLSCEICAAEEARVSELIDKLEHREITVSVIGQFKRGKSTLVNAILEEELLPVGIIPVTSAVTHIRHGERSATVHFENGAVVPIQSEALSDYISEQKNPDNRLGVSSVTIHTLSDFLRDGLTFVDTPGVGSFHRHNSDAAYASVRESDAVIFMLSVDSPINQIEIDFLSKVREYAAKFYFAVNKIDTVPDQELSLYLDYCGHLLCQLLGVEAVSMFPVSARRGDGLAELKDAIENDCKSAVIEILERSTRLKLIDLIGSAVSRIDLYWSALQLPPRKFEERFLAMEQRFLGIRERAESVLEQETMAAGGDPDRRSAQIKLSNRLVLRRNEIKRELAAAVRELFGMDYYFEMTELNLSGAGCDPNFSELSAESAALPSEGSGDLLTGAPAAEFREDVDTLCQELAQDLNRIMLYHEDDTYVVARRTSDLNKLIARLNRLREELNSDGLDD